MYSIVNLVSSFAEMEDMMILAAHGKVRFHTSKCEMEEFQRAIDDVTVSRVGGGATLIT